MAGNLTYRLFREDDLPGLLRLWDEETDWGPLTEETWRRWYVDTPYGPCAIVVAVDEQNQVVGQMVFTPTRVRVGRREVTAARLSAPILRRDVRGGPAHGGNHPLLGFYRVGTNAVRDQGWSLVYALPEASWLPFFRMSRLRPVLDLPPLADAEFPCMAATLEAHGPFLPGGRTVQPAEQFGSEYDEVWESARTELPVECGVVRSPGWLRYRLGGHLTLSVRDSNGRLLGYVAIHRKRGLIVDWLARSRRDFVPTLGAVMGWLKTTDAQPAEPKLATLTAMATPRLAPALRELGFAPVDYRFAFVCTTTLDPSLAAEEIAPERWYIMPGD